MKLETDHSDNLGAFLLEGVSVADADTSREPVKPRLARDMDLICERIMAQLDEEGVETDIDRLDLQIAVSRALMQPDGGGDVFVRLTVRFRGDREPQPEIGTTVPDSALPEWDELFDVAERREGEADDGATI